MTTYIADTNIIIRLLVKDDEAQFDATVRALTELERRGEVCLVPDVVWLESCWVLEKVYKLQRSDIANALTDLMLTEVFRPMSDFVRELLAEYARTTIDPIDLYLSSFSVNTGHPVLTWNHKDFRKLGCEWITPDRMPAG